jgi:hypothetical protein
LIARTPSAGGLGLYPSIGCGTNVARDESPTIALSDWAEIRRAGYERSNGHPIIFCSKLKKAHEYLRGRGAAVGPIQRRRRHGVLEVQDPESNVIEICKEP